MKLRPVLFIAFAVGILSSCGVNDLEDRLDKIENALGTNEPLAIDFKTTNLDDQEIIKKTSYLFKTSGYNEYINDNGDGTFEVYIERFSDVEWYEGAWISFTYDPATKETSDESTRVYFYDKFGNYVNPRFTNGDDGNTFALTVKSINVETGAVNVSVVASTDATAANNEFTAKPMTCNFTFAGTLPVFEDN